MFAGTEFMELERIHLELKYMLFRMYGLYCSATIRESWLAYWHERYLVIILHTYYRRLIISKIGMEELFFSVHATHTYVDFQIWIHEINSYMTIYADENLEFARMEVEPICLRAVLGADKHEFGLLWF